MASIPYEASEIERFTPACLADIENPPVFRLKAASRRERKRYELMLGEEGLRYHSTETVRTEMLTGLQALWEPEHFEKWEPVLRQYWEARDDWSEAQEALPEAERSDFLFDDVPEADIDALIANLTEHWPPLRKMGAERGMYLRESPKILLGVILSGWSELETPFAREGGLIPLDTIDAIEVELLAIETRALGEPTGLAFSQLALAASRRMYLSASAEKNSSSPPPSSTSPPSSTDGTASVDGMSKASANSTETPAT